jgi:hypothetical protein
MANYSNKFVESFITMNTPEMYWLHHQMAGLGGALLRLIRHKKTIWFLSVNKAENMLAILIWVSISFIRFLDSKKESRRKECYNRVYIELICVPNNAKTILHFIWNRLVFLDEALIYTPLCFTIVDQALCMYKNIQKTYQYTLES